MSTTAVPNFAYELFIAPYHHGVANIQNSFNGRSVTELHATAELEECVFFFIATAERIASFVVGVFLLIPLINTALYGFLTLCESPYVHPFQVRGTETPFWELINQSQQGLIDDLNYTHTVSRDHLDEAVREHENIPEPPTYVQNIHGEMKSVETAGLRSFFPSLNFTDPNRPGYRDPERIEDDGSSIIYFYAWRGSRAQATKAEIERRIEKIIDRIQNRLQFTAVPEDRTQRELYYQKLEKLIKHIVKFLHEEPDPDVVNSVIIDLACMSTHCGGRYMGEAHRLYSFLKNRVDGFAAQTIESKIKTKMTSVRKQILLELIQGREGLHWMSSPMSPHIHNYYLHRIGPDLGLPGADVEYNDRYRGYRTIYPYDKRYLVQRFHELYNPRRIHSNICEIFNGSEDGSDPNAIHRDVVLYWFKDQFTEPNPPPFARAYILENRQRIISEHTQHLAESQAARTAAIQERDQIDQRINQLPQARRAKARELIALKRNVQAYLQTLGEAEREALLNQYGVAQNLRFNEERVVQYLQQSAHIALNMPQTLPRNAHIQVLGMNPEELSSFQRDILRYISVSREANEPPPAQHLSEADLLVKTYEDYRTHKLLEDLGEGNGQRIRPEAVVDCLTTLGILQLR